MQIDAQSAAKPNAAFQVGVRLPLPAECRKHVGHGRRQRPRRRRHIDHHRFALTRAFQIRIGREIFAVARRRNGGVAHTMMLGVVEEMTRRRVNEDDLVVVRITGNVALAHEADLVVLGVVVANAAVFFATRH